MNVASVISKPNPEEYRMGYQANQFSELTAQTVSTSFNFPQLIYVTLNSTVWIGSDLHAALVEQ